MKFSRDPEPETVAAEPRRRWRRWLFWVGGPLLLVIAILIGWAVSANSGLSSAMAEADRLDPGWRLDDLEAKRVVLPDAENGAEIITRLKSTPTVGTPNHKLYDLLSGLDPPRLLNDQQEDALQKLLDAYNARLPIARSLKDTPRGRHNVAWAPDGISTLLLCHDNRVAEGVLRYDVLARCQAGDIDGAMDSCLAGLHAGASIGDEPTTISMLTRIACQAVAADMVEHALAQGEPSPALLAELQKRIEAEEAAPLLLIAARGERALNTRFFEALRTGKLGVGGVGGVSGFAPGSVGPGNLIDWMVLLPGFVSSQQSGGLAFMNRLVETAKLPPEQWAAPFAAIRAETLNLPVLARMLAPAMDKVAEACRRNHAVLRCTIVALAVERFRKETGRWPERIDDLVSAGYLKTVPTDPFDGQPLRLKRTEDGWIVYSVGVDNQDNGGTLRRQNPSQPGSDVGIQLWDVVARRQPPAPPKPLEDRDGVPAPGEPPPGAPPGNNPPPPPPMPPRP